MPHACFGNRETKLPGARQHLGVDEKAVRVGQDAHERVAAEDLESAVDVAHRYAEQRARQQVVAARIELAQHAILPAHAIANRNRLAFGQG